VVSEFLPERQRRIVLLAEALLDLLHLPETSTGAMLRRSTLRGEVGTLRLACPDCSLGRAKEPGWVTDRFRRRLPCVTCGGRLEERAPDGGKILVRAKAGRGWLPADEYTGAFVGSGETDAPARFESWLCNFCHGNGTERGVVFMDRDAPPCPVCGGSGRREHSPFVLQGADPDRVGDPETVLEQAIQRRDEAGDFHALEVCIAELARRSMHRWRVFHQVHIVKLRTVDDLSEDEARWRREALERLDVLMSECGCTEIRVPGYLLTLDRERRRALQRANGRWADPRAIAVRDAEIRRLYDAGQATVEELVHRFGVQKTTVYEAIHRGEAAC
jgi:hypothetical protein